MTATLTIVPNNNSIRGGREWETYFFCSWKKNIISPSAKKKRNRVREKWWSLKNWTRKLRKLKSREKNHLNYQFLAGRNCCVFVEYSLEVVQKSVHKIKSRHQKSNFKLSDILRYFFFFFFQAFTFPSQRVNEHKKKLPRELNWT